MPNKTPIGSVKATFDDAGQPVSTVFLPAEFRHDVPVNFAGGSGQVKSEAEIVAHATRALAAYFVYIGNTEMHDPDLAGITHEVVKCDKSADLVKYCEVVFYLTEKSSSPGAV
jgi:hypothetical protein